MSHPQQELIDAISPVFAIPEEEETRLIKRYHQGFSHYFPHNRADYLVRLDEFIGMGENITYAELSARVWQETLRRTNLSPDEELFIIWDDASYRTLSVRVQTLTENWDEFISMPPHMYVVPLDVSWCACFKMTGDMGFGYREIDKCAIT